MYCILYVFPLRRISLPLYLALVSSLSILPSYETCPLLAALGPAQQYRSFWFDILPCHTPPSRSSQTFALILHLELPSPSVPVIFSRIQIEFCLCFFHILVSVSVSVVFLIPSIFSLKNVPNPTQENTHTDNESGITPIRF